MYVFSSKKYHSLYAYITTEGVKINKVFFRDSCCSIISFLCSVSRSLVVLLSFFFWPLYYLSFCLEINDSSCPFSFDHWIICPSVWRSLVVLLSFFFWPLYCLSFCLEITGCPLVLFLLTIVLSVLLFGDHWFLLSFFFWPLYYLSFCLEITGSSCPFSFDHCIICPSVWRHWLSSCPFSFDHCIICPSVWRSLVPLVLFLLTIVLSVLLFGDHWLSSCPFSFNHCIVCPSVWRSLVVLLSFFFWPLYYLSFCLEITGCPLVLFLLTIVLSVLLFGDHWFLLSFFFWPLYYLSFCLEITGCPLSFFF